ncbi:MAG: hypothetical protein M3378_09490 [Actinomycetota bacterium]|nr:hypothetical protein [Actinomycetota bacterium]MDQ3680753.1 hypothetical protein [Actinomycetota bacterium]
MPAWDRGRERRHVASTATVAAVLVRPWLWATALRQAMALTPRGWWRRRPHLPWPDPAYLAFRLETMYGDSSRSPAPREVVAYLRWCRMQRRGLR